MKKLELDDVNHKTFMNQSRIKDLLKLTEKYTQDPEKTERINSQYCICCYYSTQLAGQAFTNGECGLCGQITLFPNTNVDRLCSKCAKTHKLCVHCGSDIEYKKRKKL